MSQPRVNEQPSKPMHIAVPSLEYSYAELADIYNQARVDYIVPMPMNARRMKEYVENYDVSLDMSLVAIAPDDKLTNGIGMLGWREGRGWITRLGIIPSRRRRRTGQYLMEQMLANARNAGAHLVQLEVIK
ncbi:MAG: GNAT family N-acetyltransferase, partial [Aggregatilineales bacterium]